ncbi:MULTISPECIES: sporulation protein [Thermomonosporaceae]|uniref:sporulation protein n=1 Tax=Thermomonosporaceae TaxID=2012 RepID=UPI00255A99A7|nr:MULTISPECIES: sporulation protein [Thermomonosporaceae]MDL4774343.1 sporulation protein [Actinomadura xylanilytica]
MVFKRLLGAFGVGGPSVETVLTTPHCRPGDLLSGEVRLQGGDHDVDVHQVVLSLVTQVETEYGDGDGHGVREFHRAAVSGGFTLRAGQYQPILFQLPLPWELPVTEVHGQHLHGMAMSVRTELEIAGAMDKGDLDPVGVLPLPSQQRVLDAFAALGLQFKGADLEHGLLAGVHQELPFYQEIEFYAPPAYGGRISEVELTFVASPHGLAVVLEADRRGGAYSEGGDVYGRFQVGHDEALRMAWEREIEGWLQSVAGPLHGGHAPGAHGAYGHQEPYGYHEQPYGHHEQPYGHHDEHGGRGSGPGWGGVAAGAAGGLAVGLIGGAVVNELMDDDDDDGDEDDAEARAAAAREEGYQAAVFDAAVEDATEQAYEDAYEDAFDEASESFDDDEE